MEAARVPASGLEQTCLPFNRCIDPEFVDDGVVGGGGGGDGVVVVGGVGGQPLDSLGLSRHLAVIHVFLILHGRHDLGLSRGGVFIYLMVLWTFNVPPPP